MEHDAAYKIARTKLDTMYMDLDGGVEIQDEYTQETPFAWVFCHQSTMWVQTRDRSYELIGASPMLIEKHTGTIHYLPTYQPLERSIEEFEIEHGYRK